ncbi:MAG: cupin domain-containing protein [Pseudobdellovibrionaceae bacterium]|jgi:cupin superfamily acireductone dioxygenase involved in methionine salvage
MIIHRWQAPIQPSLEALSKILVHEGLEPQKEIFMSQERISDHRHPFCEVRFIVEGEIIFNVSGNQILLRAGDRIEIPANTKHSHTTAGQKSCICLYAQRAI